MIDPTETDIDYYDKLVQPHGSFGVTEWLVRCNDCGDINFASKAFWHGQKCEQRAENERLRSQ